MVSTNYVVYLIVLAVGLVSTYFLLKLFKVDLLQFNSTTGAVFLSTNLAIWTTLILFGPSIVKSS